MFYPLMSHKIYFFFHTMNSEIIERVFTNLPTATKAKIHMLF
jgi:hypothetical protein